MLQIKQLPGKQHLLPPSGGATSPVPRSTNPVEEQRGNAVNTWTACGSTPSELPVFSCHNEVEEQFYPLIHPDRSVTADCHVKVMETSKEEEKSKVMGAEFSPCSPAKLVIFCHFFSRLFWNALIVRNKWEGKLAFSLNLKSSWFHFASARASAWLCQFPVYSRSPPVRH